jgi:pimeloyl-ACP methyl ester carboxylesterase
MTEAAAIRPFTIHVPQSDLDDLRQRLSHTRFAHAIPGVGDTFGVPDAYVREMADYWRDGYDWRTWEARLNELPQFLTEIDGHPLHFFHIRSREEKALPLVLLHGWPGSVVEFLDVIGPLTDPVAHGGSAEDAFHVVIPSYPGFGFSGPTQSQGWGTHRVASAVAELMRRLGYDRYLAQGGDFGAFVGPELGRIDAEHVVGVHVNSATFGFIPLGTLSEDEVAALSDEEKTRYERLQRWENEGSGYFKIHATRPQTLAYGLADSPVGLLAWIGDWFYHGRIDQDRVLTNISIYWLTNTFASSIRFYYEDMHSGNWPTPSTVPTGVANFAEDVAIRRYSDDLNTIVHWSEYDAGGHFAAWEVPSLLVQDVRAFRRKLQAS